MDIEIAILLILAIVTLVVTPVFDKYVDHKEEFEVVDTRELQLASLIYFMATLDYRSVQTNRAFYFDSLGSWRVGKDVARVSFQTAVAMHNDDSLEGSRLVKTVKLQHSRRRGVIVQSHIVKPVSRTAERVLEPV